MIKDLENLINKFSEYDDSIFLAEKLRSISKKNEGEDKYYLQECANHIESLYSFTHEILRRISVDKNIRGENIQSLTTQTESKQREFLRLPDVIAMTTLSRSSIYRMESEGKFPARANIGASHMVMWWKDEVSAWIASGGKKSANDLA